MKNIPFLLQPSKDFALRLALRANIDQDQTDVRVCQHPGCQNGAIECVLPPVHDKQYPEWDKEDYVFYCHKHAAESGFCHICGSFIGGINDFTTICDICRDEIGLDNISNTENHE